MVDSVYQLIVASTLLADQSENVKRWRQYLGRQEADQAPRRHVRCALHRLRSRVPACSTSEPGVLIARCIQSPQLQASHFPCPLIPLSALSEELQNIPTTKGEKGDDLIRVLRELITVQRKIACLQVELQGRKDDKNVSQLTHANEMEKKCETLARMTFILKDVIQNKDRIVARLQQPYSLDCIPVEAEYQKQFSELLMTAASDYGTLTASVADFQWSQNFKEPPSVWGEMLRPIPVALASCTRFFEAMSAMRESFATLQDLRVGHLLSSPTTPAEDSSLGATDGSGSQCVTPPPWRTESSFNDSAVGTLQRPETERREAEDETSQVGDDGSYQRRLSWPAPGRKDGT